MDILYFMVILFMIIQSNGVIGITVVMNKNITATIGDVGEILCSYTKENVQKIYTVGISVRNTKTNEFVPVVTFLPGSATRFTTSGEYLRNRVILSNITQNSTEASMMFNQLKCTDENEYRCKVFYLHVNNEPDSGMSLPTSIKVNVMPSKPEMFFKTHLFSKPENRNVNDTESETNAKRQKRSTQLIPNKERNETAFMEGDNITFTCTGNVGNPEGTFVWHKMYYSRTIFNYSDVSTESLPESCSFNGTSNLTIQMTANDNKAKIRCIVQSEISGVSAYTDSEPLQVYFKVRKPLLSSEPNVSVYKTGESVQLNCKADGNPNPHYYWFKGNISDTFISDNDTLVITNANISDSGVYTCNTSNEINGEIFSEFKSRKVRIVNELSSVNINSNITKHEHSNGIMLKCSFNISDGASFHSIALAAQNKTTGEFKDVVGTYIDGKSISTAFGVYLFGNVTAVLKHNSVFMLNFNKLTFKHERLYKCILIVRLDDPLNTNAIESGIMQITVTADESKTPSSGHTPISLGAVIGCVAGAVFIIVILIVIVYLREKNTPPQPSVYSQVDEASKLKNKHKYETLELPDKQEEDPYAETQEGVYDETGNLRHKENKNAEQFDVSTYSSKQNSNGDNKLSIQTSHVGSYSNQGFEKDENRKVATGSPTVRSSSGSQNDEQTNSNRNSQSKKGYENIIGTDQTDISEEESSHRTTL